MPAVIEPAATRDDRLAAVLDGLLGFSEEAGGRPSVSAVDDACREHPDLAAEIRELVGTAGLMREFLPDASATAAHRVESRGGGSTDVVDRRGPADAASVADAPPGYRLLGELGRGGMGVVYRAEQVASGRAVALKMIRQAALASPEDAGRFRREALATARLNHPHIVPVFEVGGFGSDGGEPRDARATPFFSMRLVEGETLDAVLRRGPPPPRELAATLAPVARAVDAAHRAGVLHRDLKPSNILLDAGGRPFVSDFGLAGRTGFAAKHRTADDGSQTAIAAAEATDATLTRPGAILGTPQWMSPEQAAGRRDAVGVHSDVYALGAILYAGLTGRPPHEAETPAATVLKVIEQEVRPPQKVRGEADPDLSLIALKCLQKPADLRYPTAAALADDLDAYLAGEPISARSGRFTELVHRLTRETHHAPVLENWGLLWMWHAVVLVFLCVVTNALQLDRVASRWPYTLLWTVGLGTWAAVFWGLRRRAGPITFVERQIAHVWAAGMACSMLLFGIESLMGLPPLSLSPVLGLVAGTVFLSKAGILSGLLYLPAAACFAVGAVMAWWKTHDAVIPDYGLTLFGLVSAAGFFFPGWKYRR